MNRHDLAAANRTLLENLLRDIEDAIDQRDRAIADLLNKSNGKPVRPPPIELHRTTADSRRLLVEGIRAALAGDKDPFGIAAPRGIKPRLDRQGQIDAVAAVLSVIDAEACSAEHACAVVAERLNVSERFMQECYKDKDLRGWAEIHSDPLPFP